MMDRSPSFRRGGPAALFGFMVDGPNAAVTMTVRHRDLDDDVWTAAGSMSLPGPGEASFKISDLKEELSITLAAEPGRGPANVVVVPPQWLPC